MTTVSQRPASETVAGAPSVDEGGGRPWAIVAQREIVVRLTNRAFLVSTLITLLFIAGFGAFSVWDSNRTTTYTVAVTGADGRQLVERAAASARQADDKVSIESTPVSGEPAARALVDDGTADSWLHQTGSGWTLTSADDADLALRTAVESALRDSVLERNAVAAGTTVQALEQGTTLTTTRFDGRAGSSGFVKGATFAFALLFFMAAMMFGQQIAASVVEEKQSRLVEILASAIPLRQLLAGKILGNSVIALGQVVLFAAVGLVAVSFTDASTLLPTQSTTAPMTMVLMVVYVASFGLTGKALEVASFVPIASVVSMPGRLLAGDAAWWEPVLAILVMAAFSAGTIVVSERIYRRSLLQTRGRVSWKQALSAPE